MNWYEIRKLIYGFGSGVLTDVVVAIGVYLSTTDVDQWWIRGILTAIFTALIGSVRRRLLPGWLGSQN